MDKSKEKGIILENSKVLQSVKGVVELGKKNEMLNDVYKAISDRLGVSAATEIYNMFKGQQITFPVRFYSPARIKALIKDEYNGANIKDLAVKYGYSEKTIRRMLKDDELL